MATLTPTGEVGLFRDVDQFDGRSTMKCGYEQAASLANSAPVGGTPADAGTISAMAHSDYERIAGPDIPTDYQGMWQWQLHDDLTFHGLHYTDCAADWKIIKAWIACGYPVIMDVNESSVYDVALGGNPYPWDTSNYTHIIMVTGPGSSANTMKFRDTANISPPNSLRPGPREYDISKLAVNWATVAVPSWMPVPPANFDPTKPQGDKDMPYVELTSPMGRFFTDATNGGSPTRWHCVSKNVDLIGANLEFWRKSGGILGLPLTNELYDVLPGAAVVVCERAIMVYDLSRKYDTPPIDGPVYLMHLDIGKGQELIAQPLTDALKRQIADLQLKLAAAEKPAADLQATITALQGVVQSMSNAMQSAQAVLHDLGK